MENKVRSRHFREKISKRFGMKLQHYNDMLEQQGGKCSICSEPATSLDHCHDSGLVRGLLCGHCNKMLGFARDNPDVLKRAVEYLADWKRNYSDYCAACSASGHGRTPHLPHSLDRVKKDWVVGSFRCGHGHEWTCGFAAAFTGCAPESLERDAA